MKDVSNTNTKATRLAIYPKKRPSPLVRDGGVAKVRKTPAHSTLGSAFFRRTPGGAEIKRIRESQLINQIRDTRLVEEEYRYDILHYMHDMEQCTMSSATSMDQQPEIRWHMRPCLVDFLVEVHLTFRLRPETLYLTLNIIDRYVSRRIVYIKHYQLVGCAALWIAAKFEDPKDRIPTVQDLAQICRGAYHESAFIQMEYHVLDTIQWILGHPTAEAWLRVACCESGLTEDTKTQHVARFLMEITLFYREFVKFTPSTIAAGALILARHTCGKQRRPFDESDEALQVVELIDSRLATNSHDLSEVLVKKYSYSFYSKASTHILQFFLEGRRFVRQPLPNLPPITPLSNNRTAKNDISPISCFSSPLRTNTSSSESDDIPMPVTPAVPVHALEAFAVSMANSTGGEDKENWFPTATGNHVQHHPSPSKRASMIGDDPMGMSVTNMFPIAPGAVTFGRPKIINQAVPPTPRGPCSLS